MAFVLAEIEDAIRAAQLEPRGAFHCTNDDQVPSLPGGDRACSLVLIGTIGSGFWPAFNAAGRTSGEDPHPLDAYSRQIISKLADAFSARALFPFDGPPWLPFQRWAQRADVVCASAIGPLIHPQYGLWHAYRGALGFAEKISGISAPDRAPCPCDSCRDKPCLSTCPVGAFNTAGYAVPDCVEHLLSPSGQACMETGCLARQACPVGVAYRYQPEHAHFHMRTFMNAQSG